MAVDRKRVTELIDQLSEKDLVIVNDLLERLAQLNMYAEIPLDDEPTTREDLEAIKAAHQAYEDGELIDLKDIEHELRS